MANNDIEIIGKKGIKRKLFVCVGSFYASFQ